MQLVLGMGWGEHAGLGQGKRKGRGRRELGKLEDAKVARAEHGTGAEGRDHITSVLPGHGKAFGLVLFAMGSHSFRVGEGLDVKHVFERWVCGRTDCREEDPSRGAMGSGPDAGSLGQRIPAGGPWHVPANTFPAGAGLGGAEVVLSRG